MEMENRNWIDKEDAKICMWKCVLFVTSVTVVGLIFIGEVL